MKVHVYVALFRGVNPIWSGISRSEAAATKAFMSFAGFPPFVKDHSLVVQAEIPKLAIEKHSCGTGRCALRLAKGKGKK